MSLVVVVTMTMQWVCCGYILQRFSWWRWWSCLLHFFALDNEVLRTMIMLLPRLPMMMRGQGWTFTDASIPGRLWTLDKYSLWDPRNADIPAALLFNTQIQTAIQNKYNQFGIVERSSVESWIPCKVIITSDDKMLQLLNIGWIKL